eukprot:3933578-Rhodomonas_salina.1
MTAEEAEAQDENEKFFLLVVATGISEARFGRHTKRSFGIPDDVPIMKHQFQNAIFNKITRDIWWAGRELYRVIVQVIGQTGQYDKKFIMLAFNSEVYRIAFKQICTATTVEDSPDGDPFRVDVITHADGKGFSVKTYTRYDFWLPDGSPSTASSFLWVAN